MAFDNAMLRFVQNLRFPLLAHRACILLDFVNELLKIAQLQNLRLGCQKIGIAVEEDELCQHRFCSVKRQPTLPSDLSGGVTSGSYRDNRSSPYFILSGKKALRPIYSGGSAFADVAPVPVNRQ